MMKRFCAYAEKVFKLSVEIEKLTDGRQKPRIPTSSIFLSVLMMYVVRIRSLNALEWEFYEPKKWAMVIGKRLPSADRMGEVMALMDDKQIRGFIWAIHYRMKRNKVLDKGLWGLRIVTMDGHEFSPQW